MKERGKKKEEEARGKYDVATQCGTDLPVSIKHFLLPTYKPLVANLHQIRVYFLKNKSMGIAEFLTFGRLKKKSSTSQK